MSARRHRRRGRAAGPVLGGLAGLALLGGLGVGLYFLLRRPACTCPTGATPVRYDDGACGCSEVSVSVLGPGSPCRASAECPPGYVCFNGECHTLEEWEA